MKEAYSRPSYMIMTPGPTQMHVSVLSALSRYETNPDLDPDFLEFYRRLSDKISTRMAANGPTVILGGEGILGLEAACASFIEAGDRVLTISNGIFGKGFDDFSKMYGGNTTLYEGDLRRGLDSEAIDQFIEVHGPFKVATLVHCETPSGITNDIQAVAKVLGKHKILSIVDSVSGFGGEPLKAGPWGLDVVLSGSQKVLSAPAGLSTVTMSQRAVQYLRSRTSPIPSYYANLKIWLDIYENRQFPYTQPVQLLYALDKALDRLNVEYAIGRHKTFAGAVRGTLKKLGFEIYALDHESNTVTSVCLPEGIRFESLFNKMRKDHDILIGGGFDFLEDKIFRIGHMGENLSAEKLSMTMEALQSSLSSLGLETDAPYASVFREALMQQKAD